MKIYSWNVNGIRAVWKKGAFQQFIKEHDPDILLLQETKAEEGQSPVELPQYKEYWNSAEKKGYSGTAIFTKEEPLNILHGFPTDIAAAYGLMQDNYGDPLKEGRVITAEFKEIYVVSVYTPNAKDDLTRLPLRHQKWDKAFLDFIKYLENKKPVVFAGDFNVAHTEDDLARPKPNIGKKGFTKEERQGFQNFVDAGYIDTLRMFVQGNGHYTWWSHFAKARERNVGWRIDYVMVSATLKNQVKNAQIHANVLGSDHCPISIELA